MPPHAIRLNRTFDVQRLQADLIATNCYGKVAQFGEYHSGDWTGLSLRSEGGELHTTRTGLVPTGAPFRYTPVIDATPYFKEVLESFRCPQRSVRLLHLSPSGRIEPHVDAPLTFAHGILRLHIPIVTHPDVEFVIDGQRCFWRAGELWWGDFSRLHHVYNLSAINRVHLVIDVEINEYLLELFPREFRAAQLRDGILFHREAIALTPAQLRRFECVVEVAAGAISHPTLSDGCTAAFRVIDGKLMMAARDEAVFTLDPIGDAEFGIVGWSRAITMQFTLVEHAVRSVRLVIKGLPKDLGAPESSNNPRLAVHTITLPCLVQNSASG